MLVKSSSRMLIAVASAAMLSGIFVSRASAHAACSNEMLRGHYAHLIQGLYGPDTTPLTETYMSNAFPFQAIQMLEFDGRGGITGSESIVVSGAEFTENAGTHFVPVVGSFTVNPDCTGIAYLCSNHMTGTVSGGPGTCTGTTINTSGFVWEDFVKVTVVLANGGKTFHMLVIPPFDNGGVVRTISSTGTKLEDETERRFER
jgi:hypothetical protein